MRTPRLTGRLLAVAALSLGALMGAPAAAPAQTFSTFDSGGALSTPHGIAVDQDGFVYVADLNNSLIRKYTNVGVEVTTFAGAGAIEQPVGVGLGNQQTNPDIYVANQGNDRVIRMNAAGTVLQDYGAFANPTGVDVDEANHVWVTDATDDILVKFAPDGTLLNVYGRPGGGPGSGPGEFNDPTDLSTDPPGDTFVADQGNARVQKLDPFGAQIWQIPGSDVGTPWGVDRDLTGNVWVTDQVGDTFRQFDENGSPLGAAIGGPGTNPGEFSGPTGIAVDCILNVFVSDTGNDRVQRYGVAQSPPCIAPFNTRSPETAGTAQVGSGLALDRGDWGGVPTPTFSQRWQRCSSTAAASCGDIPGERGLTYEVTDADRGFRLRAVAIATNTEGTVAEPTDMTPLIPVPAEAPLPPVNPNPPPSPPPPPVTNPSAKRVGFGGFRVNCPVTGRITCQVRGDVVGTGKSRLVTLAVATGTVRFDTARLFELKITKKARRLLKRGYDERAILRVVVDGERLLTKRIRFNRKTAKRLGG